MVPLGLLFLALLCYAFTRPSRPDVTIERAVQFDDMEALRRHVEYGTNPNREDFEGTPLLYLAARKGNLEMVRGLLKLGALVDAGVEQQSPLQIAAFGGHLDVVRELIEHGASIENKAFDGATPLHSACWAGRNDVVKELLNRGAKMSRDKNGYTPILCAARQGFDATVKILLSNGADVNDMNPDRETVLHLAAQHCSAEIVALLVRKGANVHAVDKQGNEPLIYASQRGDTPKLVVECLLAAGADPNRPGKGGLSPLFHAFRNPDIGLVLLAHMKEVAGYDEDGHNLLFYAVQANASLDLIKALHERGCSFQLTEDNRTLKLMEGYLEPDTLDYLRKNGVTIDLLPRPDWARGRSRGD